MSVPARPAPTMRTWPRSPIGGDGKRRAGRGYPRAMGGPRRHGFCYAADEECRRSADAPRNHPMNTRFEALESRLQMSATVPTTTVLPTAWRLVVRYEADAGVDVATLGNNDIRVEAPARTVPGV